jgi:hypothetical protein
MVERRQSAASASEKLSASSSENFCPPRLPAARARMLNQNLAGFVAKIKGESP